MRVGFWKTTSAGSNDQILRVGNTVYTALGTDFRRFRVFWLAVGPTAVFNADGAAAVVVRTAVLLVANLGTL